MHALMQPANKCNVHMKNHECFTLLTSCNELHKCYTYVCLTLLAQRLFYIYCKQNELAPFGIPLTARSWCTPLKRVSYSSLYVEDMAQFILSQVHLNRKYDCKVKTFPSYILHCVCVCVLRKKGATVWHFHINSKKKTQCIPDISIL